MFIIPRRIILNRTGRDRAFIDMPEEALAMLTLLLLLGNCSNTNKIMEVNNATYYLLKYAAYFGFFNQSFPILTWCAAISFFKSSRKILGTREAALITNTGNIRQIFTTQ